MPHSKQIVNEAIRLRVEEQLGLETLSEKLGVAKSTLSRWLKGYPLDDGVVRVRMQDNGKRFKKYRGDEADIHRVVRAHNLNPSQVGKVSEAAIALRLLTWGFNVFGSVFDGDRTDWIVEVPSTGKVWKIQVKTAHEGIQRSGLPSIGLKHRPSPKKGYQRYLPGEFDFLVGYDLYTDIAYVWSWGEVTHLNNSVTICPDAKERWDKLQK